MTHPLERVLKQIELYISRSSIATVIVVRDGAGQSFLLTNCRPEQCKRLLGELEGDLENIRTTVEEERKPQLELPSPAPQAAITFDPEVLWILRLRCWWRGHHQGSSGECCEDLPFRCTVCGKRVFHPWLGVVDELRFWWRWYVASRVRSFFRRCRDCGKRFNRHTDECPPF